MKKLSIPLITLVLIGLIGFTLYENKEEMEEEAKLAEVSSEAIPVQTTQLKKKAIQAQVEADGVLEANTDVTILSETQGKVISVLKEKGSSVKKGDLLAQVENEIIQAEVEAAKTNLEKLETDLERFTKLLKEKAVTQRQFEDIKIAVKNAEAQYRASKKRLENTYIRATASGKINNDFLQEGEFISVNDPLYEIVDASLLKLKVNLTAAEVLPLTEGDTVGISSALFPEKKFQGVVGAIASKADATLKYEVEIKMENTGETQLKPGMYATANFTYEKGVAKHYLLRDALIGSIQNPQVYVVDNGISQLKNITIGENREKEVEVLAGLSPNDQVVLNGQINLSQGTKVKVLDK